MESVANVYAFVAAHPVTSEHADAEALIQLFRLLAAGKWVAPADRDSILSCL